MNNPGIFFTELYRNFNERNIDLVIAAMTDDVKWANGMDGGYVHGHTAVKDYWTRQFSLVSSKVTPLHVDFENGKAKIKVQQVIHDLDGELLADELVYHYFRIDNNKIAEFNIGSKEKP